MNTSEVIWQIVKQYSDTVYFVPGGGAAFLVDALGRSGLKHISALHEQGAGFMAIGHAMATGGLGVCLVTSGPGATNAITPCAAAMGDVVSLVERAAETIEIEEAEKIAAKMAKGKFDLDDLWAQLRQMQRMGGLGALAGMMPGLKGMKGAMDKAQDSKALVHLEAMLSSMTAKERSRPEIVNAKRKIRIAKGSGTTVQEVNKLLKMHQEMATMMKRLKKMGGLGKLASMFGGGGGLPGMPGMPGGGSMPPGLGGPGAGLPGIGGGPAFNLPPGFDKFSKK